MHCRQRGYGGELTIEKPFVSRKAVLRASPPEVAANAYNEVASMTHNKES